jgi:hypothetical protein
MFTFMQDNTFTVRKQEEFDTVKASYLEMKKTLNNTKSAFPKVYPQTLPNISTHDTEPKVLSLIWSLGKCLMSIFLDRRRQFK